MLPGQLSQGAVTSRLPLALQSAFSQLRLTPGLRKVLFATALGTVALALAAHQLKRRRRKKKQVGPEMGGEHLGTVPLPVLMARKVPSVKKGRCGVVGAGPTWSRVSVGPHISRALGLVTSCLQAGSPSSVKQVIVRIWWASVGTGGTCHRKQWFSLSEDPLGTRVQKGVRGRSSSVQQGTFPGS